ncbi:uncharacterized protein ACHE_21081A [Aspergillus chevalieri]|uniref:Uncharacterized protein n=1 Tax=Aspergillus chevalieri TaxID=182096 RepID=A0A7R7ZKP2_ASPCH|nr:uncharacterized protein ACHE_21081A [Aspergillus chevalieri]BCR85623.1 hypothetical protein ACHE_21081A [Aspergillus chevalieri]
MQAESSGLCQNIKPHRFVALLGRYFQIRDDYQNLTADEYIKTKGFCEDLDEGKISLPLIYTLQKAGAHQATLRGVFHNEAHGKSFQSK